MCPNCAEALKRPPARPGKARTSGSGWSRRSPLRIVLAIAIFFAATYGLVFALQIALGAQSPGPPTGSARFESARGGFSFEYPAAWVKLPLVIPTAESQVSAYVEAAFGDPSGASDKDMLLDFVTVEAIKDPAPFTEAMRPNLLSAYKQRIAQMAAQEPGFQITEPASEVTLGGLWGVHAVFNEPLGDRRVVSENYIIPVGTMQYRISVQAVETDWQRDKALFDAAIQSFRPTGPSSQG